VDIGFKLADRVEVVCIVLQLAVDQVEAAGMLLQLLVLLACTEVRAGRTDPVE
jgi:hypothetical protein